MPAPPAFTSKTSSTTNSNCPANFPETLTTAVLAADPIAGKKFPKGQKNVVTTTLPNCANISSRHASLLHTSLLRSDRRRPRFSRSEEHTSELQSQFHLVCRLLLEKKK